MVARTAKRITQSMISAVSNRGLMRFMFYEGALNADRFIAFLRRLAKDAGQKVFLIVDNLKVHHASKVKTWVAGHAHEIELFYLPAYAPDHNPDEYLNNDLKQKLRQQPQPATQDELIKNTRAVLRAIQRSPRRIQGYFRPTAGAVCRLNVRYIDGILVMASMDADETLPLQLHCKQHGKSPRNRSLRPVIGWGTRDRTWDLLIQSQTCYQLHHPPPRPTGCVGPRP